MAVPTTPTVETGTRERSDAHESTSTLRAAPRHQVIGRSTSDSLDNRLRERRAAGAARYTARLTTRHHTVGTGTPRSQRSRYRHDELRPARVEVRVGEDLLRVTNTDSTSRMPRRGPPARTARVVPGPTRAVSTRTLHEPAYVTELQRNRSAPRAAGAESRNSRCRSATRRPRIFTELAASAGSRSCPGSYPVGARAALPSAALAQRGKGSARARASPSGRNDRPCDSKEALPSCSMSIRPAPLLPRRCPAARRAWMNLGGGGRSGRRDRQVHGQLRISPFVVYHRRS